MVGGYGGMEGEERGGKEGGKKSDSTNTGTGNALVSFYMPARIEGTHTIHTVADTLTHTLKTIHVFFMSHTYSCSCTLEH